MLNLDSECFTVQNGSIVQGTLRDFERFIEIEPTPHGIQRKYFIRCAIVEQSMFDDESCDLDFVSSPSVSDDVVWAVMYWQHGCENILDTFDNEQDALAQLEEYAVLNILNNAFIVVHLNRKAAENELSNLLEDQAL